MSEEKIIKCPICDEGDIKVLRNPSVTRKSLTKSRAGGSVTIHTSESYEALEGCPKCGKSRDDVERALKGNEPVKHPSREEILRRLKEAGMSTKVKKNIEQE